MAAKCSMVHDDIYNLKKGADLDSWTIDQLDDASTRLARVELFLWKLEEVHPMNAISAQLGDLFVKAHKGFCKILHHIKDQHRRRSTIRTLISNVLEIFKLENNAEPLKASEASRSTSQIISNVLEMIKPENICELMEASKPSRSSSRISMEMVGLVKTLLDCTASCLYHVHHRATESVLKKKLPYLRVFLTFTAERCIEHESMKDIFTHVEDVAYTAAHLCLLESDSNRDSKFSKLLKRMSPFRPKLRQIYLSVLIGSKSSGSETKMNANCMSDFLKALQEDLQELLIHDASLKVAFDDPILWLQQGLSYLSGFLLDIASKCTPLEEFNSLRSHIEALSIETAILIYSSYDEEMDKITEMDHALFHLQPKFHHVKVEVDLIQLINRQATIIAPLKNLTDYVWGELIFLGTILMDSLQQCKEHTKITDVLTLIQSVDSQAWSVIKCLSHNSEQEELAREINSLHFQLLLKFKFIKAAIAQICPNISASSTSDHPTINLLNFLPINFEVIDSYFIMLKTSKTSSSDIPMIHEVFMGFHEYILVSLFQKTVTIANEVKKFLYGLLVLVTYLLDPLVQGIGCMKKNNLLTGFEAIVIDAESAICLIYEDTVDDNKCRKVNLVLQFLAIAFKLIESEGSLTDLLKHKATLKAQTFYLIESSHEELVSVRAFLMDVLTHHTDLNYLHDLLMFSELTAHKLAQISSSCYDSFIDGKIIEKMRLSLSDLQQEIESVKVEFRIVCFKLLDASPRNMTDGEDLINFLLNHQDWLLNCDACSIPSLKNHIQIVKDKLVYLGSFLSDTVQYLDMHQELKNLVNRVLARKYVCLFHIGNYIPACYYMLYLSDVKQLLKFVEAEIKMICRKVPDSSSYSFPRTNGLGFINCFLGKLEEILSSKFDSIIDLRLQIRLVKEGLLCVRSLSDHFAERFDENDEVYSLIASVTEVAYKAEYIIDSCLTFSHPLWYKVLLISEVVENIKLVNKVVSETCERKKIDETMPEVANTSTNLFPSLSANTPRANEEMEGFQDAMNVLKKQLLEGSPQLDVISLVGIPGIGKTTLAEKIYNDPIVTSHFDVCARCHVTQVYSWRDMLLTILNGVLESADRNEKEDSELADELHRFLLTKKFLVLIDDVWDNEVGQLTYVLQRCS